MAVRKNPPPPPPEEEEDIPEDDDDRDDVPEDDEEDSSESAEDAGDGDGEEDAPEEDAPEESEDEQSEEDAPEEGSEEDSSSEEDEDEQEPEQKPARKLGRPTNAEAALRPKKQELSKKEAAELFKRYEERKEIITELLNHLATAKLEAAEAAFEIYDKLGVGPFRWKGKTLKVFKSKKNPRGASIRTVSDQALDIG